MRTILIIMMLVLTLALAACGSKDEAVEDPMADAAAAEQVTPEAEEIEAIENEKPEGPIRPERVDILPVGPVGTMQLADGTELEITNLLKVQGYYLYVVGKLNGRSSSVISFTRFQDVKRWKAFIFKDQSNFIITTKAGKELIFMDARLYLGTDSGDEYVFTTLRDYEEVEVSIRKSDVATITFN